MAWALRVLGVLVLVVVAIQAANVLLNLPSLNSYSSMAGAVIQFVPLGIAIGLLDWGSGHMFAQAKEAQQGLEEKVVGYIVSNRTMSFDTLSRWTGLPLKKAADLAARLAARGKLPGYTIDLASQSISNATSGVGLTNPAAPPPMSLHAQTPFNPSDEVVRVKAKLYELEALKKQGRITEGEYGDMKDELEKKLANLDTGTQVY